MLSTADFPKKQVEAFLQAYQNNPLKAAACSAGLDLYQGYIIATVAVEIQAAAIIGAENLQSLNGLTPEEHRAATGGVVHKLK